MNSVQRPSDSEQAAHFGTRAKCGSVHRVPAVLTVSRHELSIRPRWGLFGPPLAHVGDHIEIFVPKRRHFWTAPQMLIRGAGSFSLVQIRFRDYEEVTRAIDSAGVTPEAICVPAVFMINSVFLYGYLRRKKVVY